MIWTDFVIVDNDVVVFLVVRCTSTRAYECVSTGCYVSYIRYLRYHINIYIDHVFNIFKVQTHRRILKSSVHKPELVQSSPVQIYGLLAPHTLYTLCYAYSRGPHDLRYAYPNLKRLRDRAMQVFPYENICRSRNGGKSLFHTDSIICIQ
jgi:hypothetical protein